MLAVFDVTRVSRLAIAFVFEVILIVFAPRLFVNTSSAAVARETSAVILAVLDATAPGKVLIVDEDTPPTVFTVGDSLVPPKSPPKLIPFPVPAPPNIDVTKAVVAI